MVPERVVLLDPVTGLPPVVAEKRAPAHLRADSPHSAAAAVTAFSELARRADTTCTSTAQPRPAPLTRDFLSPD